MHRFMGMVVIIGLEAALIGGFLALSGGMSMAVNAGVWERHLLDGYSFGTIIVGICGLVYLKIIWQLINRY